MDLTPVSVPHQLQPSPPETSVHTLNCDGRKEPRAGRSWRQTGELCPESQHLPGLLLPPLGPEVPAQASRRRVGVLAPRDPGGKTMPAFRREGMSGKGLCL